MPNQERILLTGATGYVGGRLLRELEARDLTIRCLVRQPANLAGRVGPRTVLIQGDVLAPESLPPAFEEIDTAYYMIHSMGDKGAFARQERESAENFAAAAKQAGVRRIVYLGGLAHGERLSTHLQSRHLVGDILRGSGVPVFEFRAAVILGSGSLSFEIMRALVDRLPVMITPRWVHTLTQPIAVEDVLAYLVAVLNATSDQAGVYEIGGPDQVSFLDLMREYADLRGLKRVVIPVPMLTPGLSSLWLGLITPVYARIGRKLIESMRNETVVRDERALRVFPVKPRTVRQALQRALGNEDRDIAQTRWSDALSSAGPTRGWGGVRFGSRLVDSNAVHVGCDPARAFAPIRRIGGRQGWYFGNLMWRLRGWLDMLVGGVGMRRGRRHPDELAPGDALDFWRVEGFEPDRLLRLAAEMKVPGRAWLQFEVTPDGDGALIRQTAIFDPVGASGLLYWYALYPIHRLIFRGMLRNIAKAAMASSRQA